MTRFLFKDRDGQTPLDPKSLKGLKPKHIQNMGELDEYEEKNIAEGLAWLRNCDEDCHDYSFWLKLHKKLFSDVWSWAGKTREKDLANPNFHTPDQIWTGLKLLQDDLKFWLEKKTFSFEETAARFHERIETIHPFPNGNGRFGRILIEYFCKQHRQKVPTWGSSLENDPPARRKTYISALQEGQRKGNYQPLVQFMFT